MKDIVEGIQETLKIEAKAMREVWNLMEAATQKKRPSEIMSREARRRLQGRKIET